LSHCLNDILYRWSTGKLAIDIVGIVSNHKDLEKMASSHSLPFHFLQVNEEEKFIHLLKEHSVDLVILARYMQILSPKLCQYLSGRAINIHHSFLPSFKGAKPYHQAYDRGVKIIGATAHYVTENLDEGPIIEQEVIHVGHRNSPKDLVKLGCDIENRVLARAISYHVEQRAFINKNKTVVFS
ncbi:MAG: formyltetrahydrofolate deformylase, partial [Simkaniaceae bacterium]|nr:formyltetrahydrofolate deformylase [Simkaniaceae bacterium]